MTIKMGKLIAIEGPDTSGKSTVIKKLKTALPNTLTKELFLFTREPGNRLNSNGGYNKSEIIREKLLSDNTLSPLEQAQLFAEARYFHTIEIIKYLKQGYNVITDRYLLSSLFYQGPVIGFKYVMELNNECLKLLAENNIDINNIVLNITENTYEQRMSRKTKDALEDVDDKIIRDRIFYNNNAKTTVQSYANEYKALNENNIYMVDANQDEDSVLMDTLINIYKIIKNN